jgi:NAD(P)-dependent dehydrogenase (short-subunit alcohol dehydrogenase family)
MDPHRLRDRVALVTGGSRGIGRATAARLGAEGAKVVILARTAESGEAVAAGIRADGGEAVFIRTDLGHEADVRSAVDQSVETFGGVHVLVNNAAATETMLGSEQAIVDETTEAMQEILQVGLMGAFWACKYTIPHMVAAQSGAIVNISSMSAIAGISGLPSDTMVKGGLHALTHQLAVEYGPLGIRVNAVAPGLIFHNSYHQTLAADPVAGPMLRGAVPLGCLGVPEDVAAAVAYLASDDARYVSGAILRVDGGASVQPGFIVNQGFGEEALAKELASRANQQ